MRWVMGVAEALGLCINPALSIVGRYSSVNTLQFTFICFVNSTCLKWIKWGYTFWSGEGIYFLFLRVNRSEGFTLGEASRRCLRGCYHLTMSEWGIQSWVTLHQIMYTLEIVRFLNFFIFGKSRNNLLDFCFSVMTADVGTLSTYFPLLYLFLVNSPFKYQVFINFLWLYWSFFMYSEIKYTCNFLLDMSLEIFFLIA